MQIKIEPSWYTQLETEFQQPYFKDLTSFIREEYRQHTVYPPPSQIFRAFDLCRFEDVKVIILGQDPYHGKQQANGLSFSVSPEVSLPRSLSNIFKELKSDLGKPIPINGDLVSWVEQGVLLLNATLTVRAGQPASHQNKGWEIFTDAVINILSQKKEHLVFLLWGSYAGKKARLIDSHKHLILKSAHPSPFSADKGFWGNRHFSQTNNYLVKNRLSPITW